MDHLPELCGSISVAHPTALFFGRKNWKVYFCSLEYESTSNTRPVLRLKRKSEEYLYILTGARIRLQQPKLTKLGHIRGRQTIILEDINTDGPWLYLSSTDPAQFTLWLRNLRKMLPKETRVAREDRMHLRATMNTLATGQTTGQTTGKTTGKTTGTATHINDQEAHGGALSMAAGKEDTGTPTIAVAAPTFTSGRGAEQRLASSEQFHTLKHAQIDAMLHQLCTNVAQQLGISKEAALALLRAHKWDWPVLASKWDSDRKAVEAAIGLVVLPDSSTVSFSGETKNNGTTTAPTTAPTNSLPCTCEICYDDVASSNIASHTLQMDCGHRFCKTCWSHHAESSLNTSAHTVWTIGSVCPQLGCNRFVSTDLFTSLLPTKQDQTKYHTYLRNHFVDHCPLLKWCSSTVGCPHALALHPTSSFMTATATATAPFTAPSTAPAHDVRCGAVQCQACQHRACFDCGKAPHGAATCEQAQCWLEYLATLEDATGTKASKHSDEKW